MSAASTTTIYQVKVNKVNQSCLLTPHQFNVRSILRIMFLVSLVRFITVSKIDNHKKHNKHFTKCKKLLIAVKKKTNY